MPSIPHECLHNYSFLGSEVVMTAVIDGLSWNIPWPLDAICYNYFRKAFGALSWDFTLQHSCILLTLLKAVRENIRAFLVKFFVFVFFFFKYGSSHTKMIICCWNANIGWETTISRAGSENKTFHHRGHTLKNKS